MGKHKDSNAFKIRELIKTLLLLCRSCSSTDLRNVLISNGMPPEYNWQREANKVAYVRKCKLDGHYEWFITKG